MGSSLSCVSCVERERDEAVKPVDLSDLEGISEAETHETGGECARQASNVDCYQQTLSSSSDDVLYERIDCVINAGVKAKPEKLQESPLQSDSRNELQCQINAIVAAHAGSLQQQRLWSGFASPSPAKSLSDDEVAYYANLALSGAKERNGTAQSPAQFYYQNWDVCGDDLAPCQLTFENWEEDIAQETDGELSSSLCAPDPVDVPAPPRVIQTKVTKDADAVKTHTPFFDVTEIPSPTRNRAKRAAWAEFEATRQPASEEVVEESCKAVEKDEAAELRISEELMWQKEMEEKAALIQMDKMCVDAFLQAVKKCARRERVRTPIKGTNLYTKHMRPCRPAGTSVDVKDSSFGNLGTLLRFLEDEGLLRLQPGLTDPVVMDINFNACYNYAYHYQYSSQLHPSAVKEAAHGAGCCCRRCTPTASGLTQYQ